MTWNWPSYIFGVLTLPAILAGVAIWYYLRLTEGSGKSKTR